MSVVDNYVLKLELSMKRDSFIDELNAVLERKTHASSGSFLLVSEHAGGTKAMEVDIYLGALNYVSPSEVVSEIESLIANREREFFPHGRFPTHVELFVQTQHGDSGLQKVFPASQGGAQ